MLRVAFSGLLIILVQCGGTGHAVRKEGKPKSGEARCEVAALKKSPRKEAEAKSSASKRCTELLPLIERAAKEANIEVALLVGLIRAESNFQNDIRSSAGAVGLTQVMPETARAKGCGDLKDPYQNILCGARVLSSFLEYYGDVILALSGYNAGHGMPSQAKQARSLPANIEYVEAVLWARSRFLFRGCDF